MHSFYGLVHSFLRRCWFISKVLRLFRKIFAYFASYSAIIFDGLALGWYHRDIWGNPTGSISVDSVDSQLCHLSSYLVRTFIDHCGLYERKRISALVADAVGVIETHFKEYINVSVICQMLNCSSQDLSTNFKKTLDMSILEYIERTRLIEAVRLLQQYPNLTNEQIMQESGYRSPRTFLRHFRDTYHCTPAEYKAKYAQN